jgi:outer membrane protein assembly factor BamB
VPVPGAGVSSPAVTGDRVFLTASDGRRNDRLHVFCFRRADGATLWHTRLFGSAPTDLYPPGGMAVPTPATDGKLLFVLFGTGDLAALDFDGKPVWIRSLAEEYGPFRNRWGMGASPILVDGSLIVLVDHYSQSYLVSIDPQTGRNRWKQDRPTAVNWSTPLAVNVAGRTELITTGTSEVRSNDAATGKDLWHLSGPGPQCIPTPVVAGDLVLASSGENTMAIRLGAAPKVLWTNKKAAAFLPSGLAYEGHVYVPGDKGVTQCLDARTGKVVWRERLGDSFHASPVAAAGRIYFASKEGVVRVVKAGETFEELAQNDLGEPLIASPALAHGQIFLRTEKHLYCIEAAK